MAKVTVLHLTDLHFGCDADLTQAAQRTNALNSLTKALGELPAGWKPQIVCITGDIGWRGAPSDYATAKAWLTSLLAAIGLDASDVIACPGNHDVDRNVARRHARPAETRVADLALRPPIREVATFAAFSAYTAFCADLGIRAYRLNGEDSFLVGVAEHRGLRFVGCNTSWYCQGDDDKNRLWIGLPFLHVLEARGEMPSVAGVAGPPTICLLHHPPDWWHEDETHAASGRQNTMDYLAHRCHLILSGHTHGEVRKADRIAQSAQHFTGGASYSGVNYQNSIRLIRLDGNNLEHRSLEFDPRSAVTAWKWSGEAQRLPFADRPPDSLQVADLDMATALATLHEVARRLGIGAAGSTALQELGLPAAFLAGGVPTLRPTAWMPMPEVPATDLTAFGPSVSDFRAGLATQPPMLDPPALPPELSERAAVVDAILGSAGSAAWVHLHAGPQCGKSVLAQLLARRFGDTLVWIRCAGLDPPAAAAEFDRSSSALAGGPPPFVNRVAWYGGLLGRLGPSAVIAIDDLPDLSGQDALSERLVAVAQAMRTAGRRLVTTGIRALPSALPLPTPDVWQGAVPPFSPQESAELLAAMGHPRRSSHGTRERRTN